MSTYIYLFEDGEIAKSDLPPTDADRKCVGRGTLTVLRISGDEIESLDTIGWNTIGTAVLDSCKEGKRVFRFHRPDTGE